MEEDCLHNTLQSSSLEPRLHLWGIGRTRFSTSMGGEQLQCWESLLFPCSACSAGWTLLLSVPFIASQTVLGEDGATPWTPCDSWPSGVLSSFAVERFCFSSWEKTWQAERCVLCTPAFLPSVFCSLMGSTRSCLRLRIASPGANLIK